MSGHAVPRIAFLQTRGDVLDRPAVRFEVPLGELLPVKWDRHGCLRPGAHRVRRDRVLGIGDPVDVDVDLLAVVGLALLERQVPRIVGHYLFGEVVREVVDVREPRTTT